MEEVIAYVRQSTLKQQSLATQKSLILKTAEQYGWPNVTFYDDKRSGRNTKRSGYQKMVEMITSGKCKVLCCYRLNRLHRNLKNAIQFFEICKKHHVTIISVNDGYFDLSKEFDRFRLNILMSLAEMESNNISEQTRNGIKEKAKQGKMITIHAPFGYQYHNGTFTIDTVKAPTIKAIFNYYLQGYGYKKIAQYLEADDNFINRKPYQVRNIILNPNYCGRVINQYGQYENMFPAIVSTTIYEEAQVIRTQKQVKRKPSENQLKQKIKCPYCHSTLTNMTVRKPDHSLRYYVCPQNVNNARFVCEFKGINAQELETSVLATCQDFFQNQQLYSKINHTIQQRLKRQRDVETKTTLNHEQLIEKLAQGKIDAETFREQTQSLRQQSKPISSISTYQIRKAFQNIIQQRFTLNMLYPYIDEINISKNKSLAGIYFKNEPLNIVKQTMK
ncbi:recombinase family protein [Staphylococcus pettenkoferi]|uniref:cassette chromosome recombinase CcrA n=1 Tax=Staphylococcus pettenkoferi TaxID=170573 RepID=UPI002274A116|nr:recombinase family protein [Staphylococcus pettenkoferi]MCY1591097.1 recombinase family protein [Staphylococcus pettenkoferi]MCY1598415.1 recombinase family protein [Staphylococcus pettenkoferi]MCY1608781.1 recombinase family protein [Staphylococcus pettenkoferi]MCY1613071.1 recombinase family protein [Staphylococcus pettenkoferi]MCY1622933.1 recombinase family protein [Staphylococcus pettenkoferi]